MFVKDTWTGHKVNILHTYNYPIIMTAVGSTETPVNILQEYKAATSVISSFKSFRQLEQRTWWICRTDVTANTTIQ